MRLRERIRLAAGAFFGNKFNQAFFKLIGGGLTSYDDNQKTYIDKGYNLNPFVYSVVNQIATKAGSIPFYIKEIEDAKSKSKIDNLIKASNHDLSPQQYLKKLTLENKAYANDYKDLPLERPNPFQTWFEFISLFETFIKCTGNIYIYLLSPEEGVNAGKPIAWYLLPSHLMQIVLKTDVNMIGIESPIDHYILTEGNQYTKFDFKDVVHIKYSNPNYDQQGSHLYGQSPLRANLRNIQSSNESIDLNIKTLQSGGAFGLIHSKGQNALTDTQAKALKERLKEMDNDPSRLAKLTGVSAEIGFTRLSLTSDELKPFDYLSFDLKQVCNVLGWDDKLMNNDEGAKYDNYTLAAKRVLLNSLMPDLKLLEEAINNEILPRYKGYDKSCWMFDISDLPEMQQDMVQLVSWAKDMVDRGVITRNEARLLLKFIISEDSNMDEFTVSSDIMTLEQSLEDFPTVE